MLHRGIAQLVESLSPKQLVVGSSPSAPAKKTAIRASEWLFSTMCSACAERDVPLGRDVCFASDVRFAREGAEHITSLCAKGAIHHYGEAITSLRQRRNITRKIPPLPSP